MSSLTANEFPANGRGGNSRNLTDSELVRVASVQRLESGGAASVEELLAMLSDPSWVVRRAVVETLGALGEAACAPLVHILVERRDSEAQIAAAVDALVASRGAADEAAIALTKNSDPAIVADAVQILGRRRNHLAIPTLIKLIGHENDNVAVGAIEALGRIGGRMAVEALIQATSSGNFFRIFPAIDILGRSGDPRVVEPLVKLLALPHFLPEAARALGRSGERSAVPALVQLLTATTDAIVRVAVISLCDLRTRYEEKSGADSSAIDELLRTQIGHDAVRRLGRILAGEDVSAAVAASELLGLLKTPEAAPWLALKLDGAPALAASAAQALRKIGAGAEVHLSDAIRNGASARRKILLPILNRSNSCADIAECLKDPDPEVRALACDTLARLGGGSEVGAIFNVLADTNLRVVHSATAAIQALGTREARTLAFAATQSPLPIVRRSALSILTYFGDIESTQALLKGLEDADQRVSETALQGLPYLEDARALEALFSSAKSAASRTRSLTMRALGHVPKSSERIVSILLKGLSDADAWVRYYACQSLGRMAYHAASEDIARLLNDPAGQVRVSAVEALSHLESDVAHTALRTAAISPDADVKRAALVGLGIAHRGEDLAIVLAAAVEADDSTRLVALSAMANFSSPLVLSALSSAASDTEEQVRSAAVAYLAARPEQEATEVLVELLPTEIMRARVKEALLIPSSGRISGLLVALESASDELAPLLISILARIPRPEARVALLASMKLNNVAARKAAATGLAARQDPEMNEALREAKEMDPDTEVRRICSLLLNG